MFTTIRIACGAFGLCLLVSTTTQADVPHYIEIPELTGTFTHGQAPITTTVDFGFDFELIPELTLEVTGTGTPGVSSTLGGFPAELLVSVTNTAIDPPEMIPPTFIGPFGETSSIHFADNTPGDLFGDFNGSGGGGGLVGVFPAVFQVTIESNPAYTDVTTASTVDITHVALSLFEPPQHCGADIGCDGFVGIADLNVVLGNWNQFVSPGDALSGDLSGDGYVGIDDLNGVLGNWNAGTPPGLGGCFNCGFIGIEDLNLVLANWNMNAPPADPAADNSGDGFIGIDDLSWILANWNTGVSPAATVPEPAALALLGLGSLAILRRCNQS